jgi:protein-L-isoaspartate(D-aspartate) O-methyltransferase
VGFLGSLASAAGLLWLAAAAAAPPPDQARLAMVRDQIEARGVKHPAVLKALRDTPRHQFVPPEMQPWAYADRPLPIGYGQTISQPYIVGYMSELLEPDPKKTVLEIGTGSGYQAAILARLFERVYTIEIVPELARQAAVLLKGMGFDNVEVRHGDGYRGWPEKAPFDRIIVTAAPPELPQTLVDQLKPGGILVAPVGRADQDLIVLRKKADGRIEKKAVLPVIFVPMVPGKD